MTVTLVLTQNIFDELIAATQDSSETAGVLLAKIVHLDNQDIRLLSLAICWVPPSAYSQRDAISMAILSEGYVHALGRAEALGATAIWLHTHPGINALPQQSQQDVVVERQISDLFFIRTGAKYYGTLIVSPRAWGMAFTGSLTSIAAERFRIDRIWSVGDRFRLVRGFDGNVAEVSPIYDRQVRAFGRAIQDTLSDLNIGIVGCGGTGSAVAEQLARLGVRTFTLFDPDELSESNVTRVYGSSFADVGQSKVAALARHLTHIASGTQCMQVKSMITKESTARILISCDVIFGCTDDNAGRLVLSRVATYFLAPVIDCGVILTSDHAGQLTGIHGRVTTVIPGQACLLCRGRIDLSRAAAELRTPDERLRLEHEGYAPALGRIEPAVVTYTTIVAATAVGELLERLVGYGPEPRPTEILLRIHDRELSTNHASPIEGHYCHPSSKKVAAGMTEPFLEQVWPT